MLTHSSLWLRNAMQNPYDAVVSASIPSCIDLKAVSVAAFHLLFLNTAIFSPPENLTCNPETFLIFFCTSRASSLLAYCCCNGCLNLPAPRVGLSRIKLFSAGMSCVPSHLFLHSSCSFWESSQVCHPMWSFFGSWDSSCEGFSCFQACRSFLLIPNV